jgi:hypothetical protein
MTATVPISTPPTPPTPDTSAPEPAAPAEGLAERLFVAGPRRLRAGHRRPRSCSVSTAPRGRVHHGHGAAIGSDLFRFYRLAG